MKSISLFIALSTFALRAFAAECNAHDHKHEHASGETVDVDATLAEAIGLAVTTASVTHINEQCVFYAYGEIDPDARRTIAAAAPGFVEFAVASLTDVEPGAALLTIRSPELIDLKRAINALEARENVYRQLGTANAALATELVRLRSQFETLSGGNEVQDGHLTERAAAAGRFRRLVSPGAKVERGDAVGELTAAGRLRFTATLSAASVQKLGDGDLAIDDDGNAFTVRRESAAQRGMVEIVLIQPAELSLARDFIGRRRRFRRQTPAGEGGAVAVPDAAIVNSSGAYCVFVRDPHDHDRYLRRKVVPGAKAAGLTAVTGVAAGEAVVSSGARRLAMLAGGEKQSAAGHFHADGQFHEGED